jgi:hypothetical protein
MVVCGFLRLLKNHGFVISLAFHRQPRRVNKPDVSAEITKAGVAESNF